MTAAAAAAMERLPPGVYFNPSPEECVTDYLLPWARGEPLPETGRYIHEQSVYAQGPDALRRARAHARVRAQVVLPLPPHQARRPRRRHRRGLGRGAEAEGPPRGRRRRRTLRGRQEEEEEEEEDALAHGGVHGRRRERGGGARALQDLRLAARHHRREAGHHRRRQQEEEAGTGRDPRGPLRRAQKPSAGSCQRRCKLLPVIVEMDGILRPDCELIIHHDKKSMVKSLGGEVRTWSLLLGVDRGLHLF